ncbi:hypothetical protein KFL_002580070 [Klebsormidium nitens]|uniref:Uncharacterized protein n=1 Tax=Klebsormidium nitens TaxID=105231 RepID=A0A1Y1ICQ5_KLENI|nr:hypothetical protein KFL_002580070 [Klebsormidium nitens]|eukprot:GAQ85858.1 hypothetical protein KFL_002580070 [Klebsormidium nitens]
MPRSLTMYHTSEGDNYHGSKSELDPPRGRTRPGTMITHRSVQRAAVADLGRAQLWRLWRPPAMHCACAEPASLLLEREYPEDKLPQHLKASGSYMLNLQRQRLASSANVNPPLQQSDYPDCYTDELEHPGDYVLTDVPVWQAFDPQGHERHRIILRTCFKVDDERFLPFSAFLASGAPKPLYLSHK